MDRYNLLVLSIVFSIATVYSAVILNDGDVDEQGLYSKSDHVVILTQRNFERKVYGKKHATVIQFYNSFCGHCRAFAPKYKSMALDFSPWINIIVLAVMDCSVEENNEICRQFEVMAYPSLRYLHEHYTKANDNVGDRIAMTDTAEKVKCQIIAKMQTEQARGRLPFAPDFEIASYISYQSALKNVPSDVLYTFLIFENENSTVGSELALDINDYQHVKVKRIKDSSELANVAGLTRFPALVVVGTDSEPSVLSPKTPNKLNLLAAVKTYLASKNYVFPVREIDNIDSNQNQGNAKVDTEKSDIVYYSDLEKTIKTSLTTEITRHKKLSGEPLIALLNYLSVLRSAFPARGNLKDYIINLHVTLSGKNEWTGSEIYDIVKQLETTHAPVYTTNLEYIGCKGSQAKYRGYSCGLWTLFHTLTVNAAQNAGNEGPDVLKAMHGYVKYFFGCTECSQHFQAMAARNKIFDVKENDKAVLWLWISHNEVNLRLAGDITEDPDHPKIQYPSVLRCPDCRGTGGRWNLPTVYQYLQSVYRADNIRDPRTSRSAASITSPLSNLDIGWSLLQFGLLNVA
ncbi:sulfhydryl oxidase 1-like isoform X2 [Plodia interpunctella]|uniref:sulfhydryl oxidase 1-like isoform X2 n=1 Tax=Plodia interpunctella TaxID=58824 RepID=UPI002368EDEF|nr:sulfhydryl oxidase 1-like isoform X2 [Plodia interpunctella]